MFYLKFLTDISRAVLTSQLRNCKQFSEKISFKNRWNKMVRTRSYRFFFSKKLWTPRRQFLQRYWSIFAKNPLFYPAKAENSLKEIFSSESLRFSLRTTVWTHETQFLQTRWKPSLKSNKKFAQKRKLINE